MRCSDIFRVVQIADAVLSPAGDAVAYVMRTADSAGDCYVYELLIAGVPDTVWPGFRGSLGEGLRSPAWSPDGRELAVAEQAGEQGGASVVLISALDGTRRRLAATPSEPESITWSPDGRELAFLAATPLETHETPVRPATSGGAEPVLVTNLSAKVDGYPVASGWQRHLFAADPATGAVRQLTAGDHWVQDFCYSPSGTIAFCGSGPGSSSVPRQPGAIRPCGVWTLRREDGGPRAVTTAEVSARCPVFVSDNVVVYIGLPGLQAEQPGLFALQVEGATPRRLAGGLDRGLITSTASFQGGHRPVAISRGEVLFCARDGGCVQLYRLSLRDPAKVRKVAGSASESIGAVSVSRSGSVICYVSSAADGCQRVTVANLTSSTRQVVASTVPPGELIQAVPEQFTAHDGVRLEGWLIRASAAGPGPLLVDVHGGSFSGAWSPLIQPGRLYQQELARLGWTILLLNSRGSDGYGSDFARAAVGAWGIADAPDFHDAIDTLVSRGLADPARLAITGYSYGGFMTNWLTATTDRFSAAVSGGSICDFVSLFGTSDMGWAMSEYDIRVRPDIDPEYALRRSPAGLGRRVTTPTLLLHGEADMRCPISQAEEWLALLLSSGCEAALVRYPAASHGFLTSGRPSFAADYGNRLVDWVTGHVAGGSSVPATSARRRH